MHVARRIPFTDQEHPEEPAIGNRATGGHRKPLGSGAGGQHTGVAVPDQARPELCELLAGITAAQHVEHRLKRAVGQLPEAAALRTNAYNSSALASSIETIATICWASTSSGLRSSATSSIAPCRIRSTTTADAMRSHDGWERTLREMSPRRDGPLGRPAAVRWPPTVEPRPYHDVDGTHVDPELQRRCGDNAWQPTCLEVVLDLSALFLADRAVVRSSDDGPRLPSRPPDAPDWAITCAGGGNGS